ncbi:hypothetical protein Gotri_008819 [Gossypium trilobum]|uniref:Uncharacterized protein n=1 Tax=Gossypium trilobum TaxID=34281 RepID=A0A7J9EL30_9ROSI|nr:hypothetical protein [Gossypium trilobum]
MPQMSIGRAGTAPSLHYGISSIPVVDKPPLVRMSPLLTSQYLSQRWIRLPARKCCDYYCHLMESHFSGAIVILHWENAVLIFIFKYMSSVLI